MRVNSRRVQIILAMTVLVLGAALIPPAVWAAGGRPIPNPGSLELIDYGWQSTPPQGYLVKAHTKYFIVVEGVTPPTVHSITLLEHTEIRPGEDVLDIGTGSGIQAIFAADKARRVVATDIDPKAVNNARINVDRYELGKRVDLRVGDLFDPIKENEKFDVVIFNLLYPVDNESNHLWTVHERFFKTVQNHLRPNGRIYYQAGIIDNIPQIKKLVEKHGLRIMRINMYADRAHEREPIIFLLQRQSDTPSLVNQQPSTPP